VLTSQVTRTAVEHQEDPTRQNSNDQPAERSGHRAAIPRQIPTTIQPSEERTNASQQHNRYEDKLRLKHIVGLADIKASDRVRHDVVSRMASPTRRCKPHGQPKFRSFQTEAFLGRHSLCGKHSPKSSKLRLLGFWFASFYVVRSIKICTRNSKAIASFQTESLCS